jgi:hypothetical protein
MNERIKELSKQACITIVPEPFDDASRAWNDTMEKFAELIVRECCDVLQTETIRHDGYGYNQGALHKKIKEHFGVEE